MNKNPIDVGYEDRFPIMPLPLQTCLNLESKYSGIWKNEVNSAFDLAKNTLPASSFAAVNELHTKWLKEQDATLADMKADGNQQGGSFRRCKQTASENKILL